MNKIIKGKEFISKETRDIIALRYKKITKTINLKFWNSESEIYHSLYVGSYGRGTAITTSDVDILVELPLSEKARFDEAKYNGQSYLLSVIKSAILETYPRSNIKADGQVVIIQFSDGIKFEILPAFKEYDFVYGKYKFTYPDTNNGGRWQSTDPKAEQEAMNLKNGYGNSNGLLKDTCKHIRRIRTDSFSTYHLSGILIDSFVYDAIKFWHWLRPGEEQAYEPVSYEQHLLSYYNLHTWDELPLITLKAPGSDQVVDATKDWVVLGKVLRSMAK